jgi:hypothetical protein
MLMRMKVGWDRYALYEDGLHSVAVSGKQSNRNKNRGNEFIHRIASFLYLLKLRKAAGAQPSPAAANTSQNPETCPASVIHCNQITVSAAGRIYSPR